MAWIMLQGIGFYQRYLSPLWGPKCRFYPTCSSYARQCYENFGFFRASAKMIYRILRCHPFSAGGFDPAIKTEESKIVNERSLNG